MRSCDDIWVALDSRFKELMDCLGQLTEEELMSTPVTGTWTVKDVIAHVWSWDEEAINTIKAWQKARPWQEDVTYDDAWNEVQVAARAGLPLINIVDGAMGAHRQLMHQLDRIDESALSQVGRAPWGEKMTLGDFFNSMALHYAAHIDDLKKYQGQCLQGNE